MQLTSKAGRGASPDRRRAGSGLAGALVVLLLAAAPAAGQTVSDRIVGLAEENARLYLAPAVSGFGAGLTSGFLNGGDVLSPLGFGLGARVSGSLIPDRTSARAFPPVLPGEATFRDETYADPYRIEGGRSCPSGGAGICSPTAVGNGEGAVFVPRGEFRDALVRAGEDPAEWRVFLPSGYDVPAVPVAMGEVNVGLPAGTEAMVRFVPSMDPGGDVGRVSAFGAGLKHSVSQWIPGGFPLHVAVAAGYQGASVRDALRATGKTAGIAVSRDLALITVFASGALERSEVEVTYTLGGKLAEATGRTPVSFVQEGRNRERFTAGLRLDVLLAQLTVAYTNSDYDVLQANLTFGTR